MADILVAPPTAPPEPMRPVSSGERISVVDILRGVALFGIITANMRGFSAPELVYFNIDKMFNGQADKFVQGFVDLFIQGKFVTLFSFLFGLGFAIQMSRAEASGKSVKFYPRRLAVLLVIGCIHAFLIWWGDILIGYALTGFVLFAFRKASQKTIAITALALSIGPFFGFAGYLTYRTIMPEKLSAQEKAKKEKERADDKAKFLVDMQKSAEIGRSNDYVAIAKDNFQGWWRGNRAIPFLVFLFVLPRFLAGLWVFRSGVVTNVQEYLPVIRKVMWRALAIGVLADAISLTCNHFSPDGPGPTWWDFGAQFWQNISLVAIACFYACLVAVLVQNAAWKKRLEPFGNVGRMALTNYLTQSLVCTWFFRLTGLYGKVGPAWDLLPTFLVYGLQVPLSGWWLQRYQFGPAEWVWRAFTYGYKPPMRRVEQEPPAQALAGVANE